MCMWVMKRPEGVSSGLEMLCVVVVVDSAEVVPEMTRYLFLIAACRRARVVTFHPVDASEDLSEGFALVGRWEGYA